MDIGVKELRDWHVNGNAWMDVGYHYVIRRDGTVEIGRPLDQAGAHTTGYNATSIGICLIGGVAQDGTTPESNFITVQWEALKSLLLDLLRQFPQATVHGHNEFAEKACPSFDVQKWWGGQQ